MGKGSRAKKLKQHNKAGPLRAAPINPVDVDTAERPTDQRRSRGVWVIPKGAGRQSMPAVDMASDLVGDLYERGRITATQEQAARTYQELREEYLAEFPETKGYTSCLAGSVPGYDDGDGDPEVIRAYRQLEKRVGWRGQRALYAVCELGIEPVDLRPLQAALDVIAGSR